MFIAWKVGFQATNMEMSRANMEIEPQNMGIYGDVFHHDKLLFYGNNQQHNYPNDIQTLEAASSNKNQPGRL